MTLRHLRRNGLLLAFGALMVFLLGGQTTAHPPTTTWTPPPSTIYWPVGVSNPTPSLSPSPSPSRTLSPAATPSSRPSQSLRGTASWGYFGGHVVTRLPRGTHIEVVGPLGTWRGVSWGYGPAAWTGRIVDLDYSVFKQLCGDPVRLGLCTVTLIHGK